MPDTRPGLDALRRAFADAFMVHPTGRMTDAEVMAVLDASPATGDSRPDMLRDALDRLITGGGVENERYLDDPTYHAIVDVWRRGDSRPVGPVCVLCGWTGDYGHEAHAKLIHPDADLAVVEQMGQKFIVPKRENPMPDTRPDREVLREALYEDAALLHHFVHPDTPFEECDGARCVRRRALASPATGDSRPRDLPAAVLDSRPDDGHDHWFCCIRCGVDNGLNEVGDSRQSEGLRDAAGRSPEWYEGYQAGMRDCDKRQSARAAAAPKEEPHE